jgi:hypothetical protein
MKLKLPSMKWLQDIVCLAFVLSLLVGCVALTVRPTFAPTTPPAQLSVSTPTGAPQPPSRADGLSAQDAATLDSLKKVDDYPLYTMRYSGSYDRRASSDGVHRLASASVPPTWACSLFAAMGDANNMLYGRNFDWEYSPAVLLFTSPPDGYASVSMVDIAYLGLGGSNATTLTELPLAERRALLNAPLLPFDGMNERGLAVGMAAVPPGDMKPDPNKETIDSLLVIRKILDQAGSIDEAVAILQRYNINMEGGPPLHYLIADRSGHAILVEFYQGKMVLMPNDRPWHLATNFLRSSVGENAQGQCWRYDKIFSRLTQAEGRLNAQEATSLLANVSQESTQWSIVYEMGTGDVKVSMGRRYSNVHTFHLDSVK